MARGSKSKRRGKAAGPPAAAAPPAEPSPSSRLRPPSAGALVALGAALLGGAVLRLRDLGGPSLWTDELVSWWAASAPSLGEVAARAGECMATPPLAFAAQHLSVAALGPSEWALRLPSALAGLLGIAVIFLAGWRMFGGAAGAASALFLAVHPFHLWWSMDARPYGIAVLLAAGSAWAFSEMLRGGSTPALAAWALCTAALLHVQFIFLPLVAAQTAAYAVLAATGRAPRLPPLRAGAALGGAALLSLPLLPQMLSVAGRAGGLVWPDSVANFPPGVYRLLQTTPLAAALLLFGLIAWALRWRPLLRLPAPDGPEARDGFVLAAAYLLPLLLMGVAAWLLDLPSLVRPRYTAAYLAPASLLLGWLLTRPAAALGRALLAGTFLLLILGTAVAPTVRRGESFNQNANAEDWRGALGALGERLQGGDVILVRSGLIEADGLYDGSFPAACASYVSAPLSPFYLDATAAETVLLPGTFAAPPYPASYGERIAPPLQAAGRIWLLMMRPADPGAYYAAALRYVQQVTGRPFQASWSDNYGSITLALLTSGQAPSS